MKNKKGNTFNKIATVLTLTTILSGYFFAQISGENSSYTFGTNVVNAASPEIAIDPYIYEVNQDYLIERQKDILARIEEAKRLSPEVQKIQAYLEGRNSPMANSASDFVEIAAKYELPYNLMPAIAVIESSAGLYTYRPYNYAGLGGQSNAMTFSSYAEAIEKHAQVLRTGYFDKGADTPEEIEQYYCYNCPTWGEKVTYVMNQIDNTAY